MMIKKNRVLKIQVIIICVMFLIVGIVVTGFGIAFHIEHTENKEEVTECFEIFVKQIKSEDYAGILENVLGASDVGVTIQDVEAYIIDSGLINLKNIDLEKELHAVDEGTSNWYGWVYYNGITYEVYFEQVEDEWKTLIPELLEK